MIVIRQATQHDINDIVALHVSAIRAIDKRVYAEAELAAWAQSAVKRATKMIDFIMRDTVFVAETACELSGFGQLDADGAQCISLYVAPGLWCNGIGSRLLRAMEVASRAKGAKSIRVSCSLNSEGFYQKHGYTWKSDGQIPLSCGQVLRCKQFEKDLRMLNHSEHRTLIST